MTLETVDINGIDILAAGGPYHGTGTAPGGEFYDVAELQRFASAAAELAGEVHIPIKLGHSKEQNLLRESGLFDEHGAPAAGWIDAASVRVEGSKLIGDAKRVPKKLADLMRAGAFRTRSAEQRRYTSQRTGKDHGWILDGLALLGGKAPAVRTLDDIVALYSAPDADLPAFDGDPPEGVRTATFQVRPLTGARMATDSTLTLTSEQTGAIEKLLGAKPGELAPEKLLAAIETATKTAETTAADKAKTELAAAQKDLADAQAELTKLKAGDGKGDSEAEKLAAELKEQLKELSAKADAGEKAAEALRVMQRDSLIEGRIRGGYLEPAVAEEYRKLYDAAPEETKAALAKLPRRDDLFKTFGADGADISGEPPTDDTEAKKAEDAEYDRYLAAIGAERQAVSA